MNDPMKRPELKPDRAMRNVMERLKQERMPKTIPLTSKIQQRHPDSYKGK
jgi:hypothetical protein